MHSLCHLSLHMYERSVWSRVLLWTREVQVGPKSFWIIIRGKFAGKWRRHTKGKAFQQRYCASACCLIWIVTPLNGHFQNCCKYLICVVASCSTLPHHSRRTVSLQSPNVSLAFQICFRSYAWRLSLAEHCALETSLLGAIIDDSDLFFFDNEMQLWHIQILYTRNVRASRRK